MTPLKIAASHGHLVVARLLIARGAAVDAIDADGCSALHGAAANGMAHTAALLLSSGASIDLVDLDGSTALHAAVMDSQVATVALLLERGASISVRSVDGYTAPTLAAAILRARFRLFRSLSPSSSPPPPSTFEVDAAEFLRLPADFGAANATAVAALLLLPPSENRDLSPRVAARLLQRLFATHEEGSSVVGAEEERDLAWGGMDEDGGTAAGCRRVNASAVTSAATIINWRSPTIVVHPPEAAARLRDGWSRKAAVLARASSVSYSGSSSLMAETALSSAVIARVRKGPVALEALLSLRNETMNFISYNQELAEALLPSPSAMPASLAAVARGVPIHRRAVSLGSEGQTAFLHRHYVAIFTQTAGRKGWTLAPPFYPRKLLEHARLTAMGDPAGGERLCAPFRVARSKARSKGKKRARGTTRERAATTPPGLTTCQVRAGETLVVPGVSSLSNWWHGTCNLDPWNAGFTLFTKAPATHALHEHHTSESSARSDHVMTT